MVCSENENNRIIKWPICGRKIKLRTKQSRQGFFRYISYVTYVRGLRRPKLGKMTEIGKSRNPTKIFRTYQPYLPWIWTIFNWVSIGWKRRLLNQVIVLIWPNKIRFSNVNIIESILNKCLSQIFTFISCINVNTLLIQFLLFVAYITYIKSYHFRFKIKWPYYMNHIWCWMWFNWLPWLESNF